MLKAVLFVLMELELVVIGMGPFYLTMGLAAAVLALPTPTLLVLTWGGLRGGTSLAVALSLPTVLHPEVFVPMTFAVRLFSALVPGGTLKRLLRWLILAGPGYAAV